MRIGKGFELNTVVNFVSVLPRTVKIHYPSASGEPLSVSQARSYLECRSVGSWPPATLTWWKKGKFMGKAKEQESERPSQLDFTPSSSPICPMRRMTEFS